MGCPRRSGIDGAITARQRAVGSRYLVYTELANRSGRERPWPHGRSEESVSRIAIAASGRAWLDDRRPRLSACAAAQSHTRPVAGSRSLRVGRAPLASLAARHGGDGRDDGGRAALPRDLGGDDDRDDVPDGGADDPPLPPGSG